MDYPNTPIVLSDSSGNKVGVHTGSINVHNVDVHDDVIIETAYRLSGATTTLDVTTAIDDLTIDVVSATGLLVGEKILFNGDLNTITVIATNTLTLDAPIDRVIASGATVERVETDMAMVGTLAAPGIFKIVPPTGEVWHLQRIIFVMNHTVEGDLSKFGGITALTNGLAIRTVKSGIIARYANWKSNNEIKKTIFDLEFTAKAKATGDVYGTSGRFTLKKLGISIKLDGDLGDYLEFRVQDDLSTLGTLEFTAEGHVA